MAGVDFTYTVGLDAKTDQLTKKISSFQESLQKRPIDINIDFPGLKNQKEVKDALDSLGVSMERVKKVTTETITLTDKQGKSYDEAKKLVVQYLNEFGKVATAYINVENQTGAIIKKQKEYDSILKSTEKTLNNTQHVEASQRKSIEDTANQLKIAITEWKNLAAAHQADTPRAKELETEIQRLSTSLKQQEGAVKTGAAGLQNFSTTMQRAIKQSFAYSLAMRAIRLAQQKLNEALQYTIDLNTEMTNIRVLQVEGAKGAYEIDKLADSFNRLAKEMGASTLEVARGSVEWLRQGKTIEETENLLKSTLMLSKLGNLSAAEATKYLTATLNGYKMEAEEATSVVDKLVAVDNVAATSVSELATALQYSAAIANETGVSFEQLVSYIGVVSETTRQNAESIGQGMKTMLTRMQDIKAGKFDEEGLGINNVEIALSKANVELRDSRDNFRDFGAVLEELAGKWDTLTEVEQAYISKAIAGVRQVNMFSVLMQNMNRAIELQEVEFSAAGLATDRYQIYLDSLQAKLEQLKAAWEGLIQDAITSGFIGGILDAGKSVLDFIEKIGGLRNAIIGLAAAFALIKAPALLSTFTTLIPIISTLSSGVKSVGIQALFSAEAMKKLGINATVAGTAINAATAAATLGISALISALIFLGTKIERLIVTTREYADLVNETKENIEDTQSTIQTVYELQKEYEELSNKIKDTSLSQEELTSAQARWYDVQKQLHSQIPLVSGTIDEQGRFIIANTEAITEQITALENLRKEQEELLKFQAESYLFDDKYGSFLTSLVDFNLDVKSGLNTLFDTIATGLNKINSFLLGYESYVFSAPHISTELEKEPSKSMTYIAEAYENMEKATDIEDYLSKKETFDEIYAMTSDMMVAAGENGAKQYADAFFEIYGKEYPVLADNFYKIAEQIGKIEETNLATKDAEAYTKAYMEALQKEKGTTTYIPSPSSPTGVEPVTGMGLNEAQAKRWLDIGAAGSQEITEYLISERIPALIKAAQELSNIFDTIGKKKLITSEQIDTLGTFGIEVRYTKDGMQELYQVTDQYGNKINGGEGSLVSSQEDLINIIKLSESQYTSYSPKQQKIIDMYIDQAVAIEEAGKAIDEFTNKNNALSSALKEQNEHGEISINTFMELYDAGLAAAVSIDKETGAMTINGEIAKKLQVETLNVAIAKEQAALASMNHTNATYYEIEAQRNLVAVLKDAKAALEESDFGVIDFTFPSASSGSAQKQEDPRIKENEELIEQIEEQIELEEDKIDAYEDEIDLIKKAQDEYHDWIDQKKKSLELTKEENDYFKEQEKNLKELADIRKEIALLQLDTSEEAEAKRLELEAQAAEIEAGIEESAEERRFDLQIEALDKLQSSFDKMIESQIEGIESIIEGIENGIEVLRDQIEDIRDIIADIRDEERNVSSNYSYKSGGGAPTGTTAVPPGTQGATTVVLGEDAKNMGITVFPLAGGEITNPPGSMTGTHSQLPNAFDAVVRDELGRVIENAAIQSATAGVITSIREDPRLGNVIEILDETNKTLTLYAHMKDLPEGLKVGQTVTAGQVIGGVGATGTTAGGPQNYHLHGEIFQGLTKEEITALKLHEEGIRNVINYQDNQLRLQENLFEKTAVVGESIDNGIKEMELTTDKAMESFSSAAKDGVISLEEAVETGILETGDQVEGFAVRIGEILRTFKFNAENNTFTEVENAPEQEQNFHPTGRGIRTPPRNGAVEMTMHSGGLVETHHDGNFAGNLKSNEVFAKLLKGEYIATEAQMNNFLKNILPTIATNIPASKYSQSSNITVSMPITVEGNLDKSVIPDIKKIANQVIEEINRSLISKGYVRPANNMLS